MRHIVHGIFIERLQFQCTRFMSFVVLTVFFAHQVLYVLAPEIGITLSATENLTEFNSVLSSGS